MILMLARSQKIFFAGAVHGNRFHVSKQNVLGLDVSVNDPTRVHLGDGL